MISRLLTLSLLTLASCGIVNRYVYRANPIQLPGLTEKGDSRVSVEVGGNSPIGQGVGGVDAQAAYAISNRISVMGGFSNRTGNREGNNESYVLFSPPPHYSDSALLQYRSNTWELGLTYTIPLSARAFCSVSAGGGSGFFHMWDNGALHDTVYNCFQNSRVGQWFLQPAMYVKLKGVELGYGFRVSETHYGSVQTNYTREQQLVFSVNALQGYNLIMYQPFFIIRISPVSYIQMEIQVSVNNGGSDNYHYNALNGGFGLSLKPTQLIKSIRSGHLGH